MARRRRNLGAYDSKMEKNLHDGPLKDLKFHPKPGVGYYIPARTAVYEPDFELTEGVYVEAKGRFRTRDEANKYLLVRESNPDVIIIFVFYDPYKPFPGSQKRKDGSKMTHSEWADKHNFAWLSYKDVLECTGSSVLYEKYLQIVTNGVNRGT